MRFAKIYKIKRADISIADKFKPGQTYQPKPSQNIYAKTIPFDFQTHEITQIISSKQVN